MATEKDLPVGLVRLDGDTQARVGNDEATIAEYTEMAREGRRPPPIDVFFDGKDYYPGDGHHRLEAFRRAGQETIPCRIHEGDVRDARLFSTAANAGLRRTNADKRNAIAKTLRETLRETPGWGDRRVAAHCHVTNKTVKSVREELFPESLDIPRSGLDGKERRPPQRQPKPAAASPAAAAAPAQTTTESLLSFLPQVTDREKRDFLKLFDSPDVVSAIDSLPASVKDLFSQLEAHAQMQLAPAAPDPVAVAIGAIEAAEQLGREDASRKAPRIIGDVVQRLRQGGHLVPAAQDRTVYGAYMRGRAYAAEASAGAPGDTSARSSATPGASAAPPPYRPILDGGAGAELDGLRTGVPPLRPAVVHPPGSEGARLMEGLAVERAALERAAATLAMKDAREGIRRANASEVQAGLEAMGSREAKHHRGPITEAYNTTWEASPKGPPPPTPLELAQKEIAELRQELARLATAEDERATLADELRRLREDAGDCGLVVCEADDCQRLALANSEGAALCKRCHTAAQREASGDTSELTTVRDEPPVKAKAPRARRAR